MCLRIIETVYHDDRMAISQLITNMRDKVVDATAIFDELIDCIHQMALMQVLPDIPLDMNDEQAHQIKRLSSAISSHIFNCIMKFESKAETAFAWQKYANAGFRDGYLKVVGISTAGRRTGDCFK